MIHKQFVVSCLMQRQSVLVCYLFKLIIMKQGGFTRGIEMNTVVVNKVGFAEHHRAVNEKLHASGTLSVCSLELIDLHL